MIDRMFVAVLLGLLGLSYGLQCPRQKTSPGREVVCYTSVSDVDQLTNAVCRCTTVVQQGHDVRNLSVSDFESFRKSLKEINPAVQFVISVDDPGKTLKTSGLNVRQESVARLIGILKEIDGVELNMTAGSRERMLLFVKSLKDELVRKSYDNRIFLVLPTKPDELAKQFDLKELSKKMVTVKTACQCTVCLSNLVPVVESITCQECCKDRMHQLPERLFADRPVISE